MVYGLAVDQETTEFFGKKVVDVSIDIVTVLPLMIRCQAAKEPN